MKRADLFGIGFLIAVVIIVFSPVFYAEYLYSDEATELWYFSTGLNFDTSVPQGRYLTYKIFLWVFSPIHTISGVVHARFFSLAGWIICLPVWYYIMMKLVTKNGLPKIIGICSLIYLICMPPFAISIGWSACMELFIAYTSGLLSGYILYEGITVEGKLGRVPAVAIGLSALFGVISLFTYQNGFGCFYLPFFIAFVSSKRITKSILIGTGISILIYIAYYLLFKYSMSISALPATSRSALVENPVNKLLFFFARPMVSAFHFTWLVNEQSKAGVIISILLGVFWMAGHFITQKRNPLKRSFFYLLILPVFLALVYLPSLIVKENFSSNRTLLALDMAVFILVSETIFSLIRQQKLRNILAGCLCFLFLINAWYNFNRQFLAPLRIEFAEMKDNLEHRYGANTKIIYVIRPREDAFKEKYGLVQSWDEFGVPSAAKSWAIEPMIKQLIYEKTGSRLTAENLVINSWPDMAAFRRSGEAVTDSTLLIDCGNGGINQGE
jgi:hypothetical protein